MSGTWCVWEPDLALMRALLYDCQVSPVQEQTEGQRAKQSAYLTVSFALLEQHKPKQGHVLSDSQCKCVNRVLCWVQTVLVFIF